MSEAKKIYAIRDGSTQEDRDAVDQAVHTIESLTSQLLAFGKNSLKAELNDSEQPEPVFSIADGMAALRTIHACGLKQGIEVPLSENPQEFVEWLINGYLRSMLIEDQ